MMCYYLNVQFQGQRVNFQVLNMKVYEILKLLIEKNQIYK